MKITLRPIGTMGDDIRNHFDTRGSKIKFMQYLNLGNNLL